MRIADDGRVFREVHEHHRQHVLNFLQTAFAQAAVENGTLVESWVCGDTAPDSPLTLEHRPISFPNYPHEWSPLMLWSAASATLDLASTALGAGFELKDATPHNQMFEGAKPLFLDLLSFVPDKAEEMIWRPHAQFVRTFLYPLLANRYFGLRLDEALFLHRDGLEPERLSALCGNNLWRRWTPPFLSVVTLPLLFGGRQGNFEPRLARDREESVAIRRALIAASRKTLQKARPVPISNSITNYLDDQTHYSQADLVRKEQAVSEALAGTSRGVLDVGANTGQFSLLAARKFGARVVAIERDPAAVDVMFSRVREDGASVLPLVVDLARPFGAAGWENIEQFSFLDRASRARFDTVLMLGVLHHLLVSERVPLPAVLRLLHRLAHEKAIIEYVDPSDPQFRKIARGRDSLHAGLTPDSFERAAADCGFTVASRAGIHDTRILYTLVRNPG